MDNGSIHISVVTIVEFHGKFLFQIWDLIGEVKIPALIQEASQKKCLQSGAENLRLVQK